MRRKPNFLALLLSLFVGISLAAGCAPAAQPAQPNQTVATVALSTATTEVAAAPTEPSTLAPTATTAPADWTTTATVEGDYYVLGNPQAPIRFIDFSDFF